MFLSSTSSTRSRTCAAGWASCVGGGGGVAVLEDLRNVTTTVLEATLEGPVPDLADVPGVVGVEPMHAGVRVR